MASKPKTATRASSRIKSQIPAPQATRTTRAKAATSVVASEVEVPVKKKATRKPLASKENDPDVGTARDVSITEEARRKEKGRSVLPQADDREPIMVGNHFTLWNGPFSKLGVRHTYVSDLTLATISQHAFPT